MIIDGLLNGTEWDGLEYRANQWKAYKMVGSDKIYSEPFIQTMGLDHVQVTKSTFSTPKLKYIFFDEFIDMHYYLPNEFVHFQNALSSFIRDKSDVQIFLIGNTVNFICPYFREMGLSHVEKQKQGTIESYVYGDSGLSVAVEFCAESTGNQSKSVQKYYAFDNPELEMITKGSWQIPLYPHPDFRMSCTTLISRDFYIYYEEHLICLELRHTPNTGLYVLARPQTESLESTKEKGKIFYTDIWYSDKRFRTQIDNSHPVDKTIWGLYKSDRFMYSDNTTGEVVRNFVNHLHQTRR